MEAATNVDFCLRIFFLEYSRKIHVTGRNISQCFGHLSPSKMDHKFRKWVCGHTHAHPHTHHLTTKSLSKCFLILSVQTHLHFLWWRRKEWLCYFARQRGNTLAPQELCPHLHFLKKYSLLIFILLITLTNIYTKNKN